MKRAYSIGGYKSHFEAFAFIACAFLFFENRLKRLYSVKNFVENRKKIFRLSLLLRLG